MSPYCPSCLGVDTSGERRCPLDHQFLHRRSCSECGEELFPRELYCAGCGAEARQPLEALLVPPPAGPYQVLGSLFLDYLATGLLVIMMLWGWFGWVTCFLAPLLGLIYRTAARSGGRQSFGQAVFHVQTLNSEAGPAGFFSSGRRGLWEFLALPRLFAGRQTAIDKLDGETLEVAVG